MNTNTELANENIKRCSEILALKSLLIEKGIITEEEYNKKVEFYKNEHYQFIREMAEEIKKAFGIDLNVEEYIKNNGR